MSRLVTLIALVFPAALWAQPRTITAQRADSVDIVILPSVELVTDGIRYNYSLHSLPSSAQRLFEFNLEVPDDDVRAFASPPGWDPLFPTHIGIDLPHRSVLSWADIMRQISLPPGATVSGFALESGFLPGVVRFWAVGYTPIPSFPDEEAMPDTIVGYEVHENSAQGTTLGPAIPPDSAATASQTAAAAADMWPSSATRDGSARRRPAESLWIFSSRSVTGSPPEIWQGLPWRSPSSRRS